MKKLVLMLICVSTILSLAACDFGKDIIDSTLNTKAVKKTFECNGLSIELTSDFLTMDFVDDTYDFIWGTEDITVMGLFSEMEEDVLQDLDTQDYAKVFREGLTNVDPSQITLLDTIPTLEYTYVDEDDKAIKCFLSFYKSTGGMWVVMFGADADDYPNLYSSICEYARSVKCK